MIAQVIDRVRKALEAQAVPTPSAFESYKRLLGQVVEGRDVDATETALVLESMNKSLEDLGRDAETYRKRVEAAGLLARGRGAQSRLTEILEEIERKEAAFALVRDKHDTEMRLLNTQRAEVQTDALQCHSAELRLRETVLDPAILARREDIRRRSREARERQVAIEDSLRGIGGVLTKKAFHQSKVDHFQGVIDKHGMTAKVLHDLGSLALLNDQTPIGDAIKTRRDHEAALRRLEAEEDDLRDSLDEVGREITAIGKELAALDVESLTP